MEKYVFYVSIKDLKEKIFRYIEIREENSLLDLASVILASFNSLATHEFTINCDEKTYKQNECRDIILKDLKLNFGDELTMIYDENKKITFEIRLIEVNKDYGFNIIYGEGLGMLENTSNEELVDIVNKIDKTGKSEVEYPEVYFEKDAEKLNIYIDDYYNYRDYSLEDDIDSINDKFENIKSEIENK